MQKEKLLEIASKLLTDYQNKDYKTLAELINIPQEITSGSIANNNYYEAEVNIFYDSPAKDDLRVIVSVNDEKFLSWVKPISKSCIVTKNGD